MFSVMAKSSLLDNKPSLCLSETPLLIDLASDCLFVQIFSSPIVNKSHASVDPGAQQGKILVTSAPPVGTRRSIRSNWTPLCHITYRYQNSSGGHWASWASDLKYFTCSTGLICISDTEQHYAQKLSHGTLIPALSLDKCKGGQGWSEQEIFL